LQLHPAAGEVSHYDGKHKTQDFNRWRFQVVLSAGLRWGIMILCYWSPLCPDFVIEVRSQTDRWRTLREKMREWIDNGAQLAWLIDPESRTAEIYRQNGSVEVLTNPESLHGEGPLEGFTLDLLPVWDPLEHSSPEQAITAR
jgi:hypothetical protein